MKSGHANLHEAVDGGITFFDKLQGISPRGKSIAEEGMLP
jgi:hypothetical protein